MYLYLKVKLSIYDLIYIPVITYGHKLWVMSKKKKMILQISDTSGQNYCRSQGGGDTFRDRVRSSYVWKELKVEVLLCGTERIQMRWF